MSVTRIATRYAKSLLELANEQGKLEAVHTDVLLLQSASKNRDLHLMLKSPIIHADKKISVFKVLFGDKMDNLTMAYMSLLANKGREGYLPEITAEFLNQYRAYKKNHGSSHRHLRTPRRIGLVQHSLPNHLQRRGNRQLGS